MKFAIQSDEICNPALRAVVRGVALGASGGQGVKGQGGVGRR